MAPLPTASLPTPEVHPFVRLWLHARRTGADGAAAVLSSINKACDVVPELLIGVAIDVIVRGQTRSSRSCSGSTDRESTSCWCWRRSTRSHGCPSR